MKRSICIALLYANIAQTATDKITRLPNNFYILDQSGKENIINGSKKPDAFVITVGSTQKLPFFDQKAYTYIKSLMPTNNPLIPKDFVKSFPSNEKTYSLYFNWEDQVGFKNIKDYGKIFAQGINYLISAYNVPIIIITYNRGGLLVNYASQLWNSPTITKGPLPILIQIGTPVPMPMSQYNEFMPNPKTISELFFFYSKQPFIVDQPSLHPEYQSTYKAIPGLSIYTILVIVNNKQPLQNNMNVAPLSENIIEYCMDAKKNYKTNKNLFLNLNSFKPEINGIIAITEPQDEKNNEEIKKSNEIIKNLEKALGRNLTFNINQGEVLRNSFRYQES